jgi:hypothetical protein
MSWKKRGLDGIRLRDGWHHLMAQRCSEAFIKQSFIYKIIYLVLIILGRPTCNGSLYRIAWSYLYRSNLLFLVSLTLSLTLSAHSACSIITKWRPFIYLYGHIRPMPIVQLFKVIVIDVEDTYIRESFIFHVTYLDIRLSHTILGLRRQTQKTNLSRGMCCGTISSCWSAAVAIAERIVNYLAGIFAVGASFIFDLNRIPCSKGTKFDAIVQ